MTAAAHRRYALLAAADALEQDDYRLQAVVADDGKDAPLTAAQVIAALRLLATLEEARDATPEHA